MANGLMKPFPPDGWEWYGTNDCLTRLMYQFRCLVIRDMNFLNCLIVDTVSGSVVYDGRFQEGMDVFDFCEKLDYSKFY
jgi:hypothetical protein